MRAPRMFALMIFVALTLTGCSVASGALSSPIVGGQGSSSAPTAAPSTSKSQAPAATQAPANGVSPKQAGPQAAASNDPAVAAIQAVIQKANQEQQDAFTQNDPTLMQDTATSSYYNQLVQINSDMANGGVSAIKLVKIEWGPVNVTSPTTAQATTYETWQTAYSDGSSDQTREQNVYTLVQEQGSWKIQTDDNPGSNPNGPTAVQPTGPSGSVAPNSPSTSAPAGPPASQTDVSRNWSGYAATGGTFTSVTGTWTVPQSQSTGGMSSGATWVGIGGVNTRDLIQAGTMETATRSGNVQYEAWVETLPQAARPIRLTVSPGDSVTVSISQQGSNQWLIQFKNNTTGESYQTNLRYASSLSSAEWIEEAPSAGRRVVPIDNFGTVQFSGGTAVENGKTVTISEAGAQPITMAGQGNSIVSPSVLTPDGQGFSVSQSSQNAGPQRGMGFGF